MQLCLSFPDQQQGAVLNGPYRYLLWRIWNPMQPHPKIVQYLLVAAIILWNTLKLARAVEELQQEGLHITEEQLAHLPPWIGNTST